MAIVILPDAQADLLSLQAYMLDKWSEGDWLKAEDEIFDKLTWVDTDVLAGAPAPELASVGMFEYRPCVHLAPQAGSTGVLTAAHFCVRHCRAPAGLSHAVDASAC
jgi:hypothetical protein